MNEILKEAIAFARAKSIDRTGEYVRRGRQHEKLTDDELRDAWRAAVRTLAGAPASSQALDAMNDLDAELALRQLDPPYEDVAENWERFRVGFSKLIADLRADPVRFAAANQAMAIDMAAVNAGRDKAN